MYQKSKTSWLKHIDFIIIDFVCMQTAFVLAYLIRHGISSPYQMPLYRDMAVVLSFIYIAVVFFNESYKNILKRNLYKEFLATVQHVSLIVIVSGIYLYLTQKGDDYSRVTFLFLWLFYLVISVAARAVWKNYLLKRVKKRIRKKRSLLIITTKDMSESLIKSVKDNNYEELMINGVCIVDHDLRGSYIHEVAVVAAVDDVLEYICRRWVDEVFIGLPNESDVTEYLSNSCIEMGITVHLQLAKVLNLIGQKQTVEKLMGYTVLSSSINMATPRQLFIKRAIDIFGSIIGIFLTCILFVFIAPCIYWKSPGPIFFSQWRVGKNGKKFKIYKFRSMYMDAEERKKELMKTNKMIDGFMFKMDKDPRVIGGEQGKGIGNFIRNTSIDEFPQFWNVLKGEMSLVGTRPPTIDEWEKYELHHRKRLAIKPGLTGLWQISGRSDIINFEEVVKLDTKYITEWNFGMDFKILFKTVGVVLLQKGSS